MIKALTCEMDKTYPIKMEPELLGKPHEFVGN